MSTANVVQPRSSFYCHAVYGTGPENRPKQSEATVTQLYWIHYSLEHAKIPVLWKVHWARVIMTYRQWIEVGGSDKMITWAVRLMNTTLADAIFHPEVLEIRPHMWHAFQVEDSDWGTLRD